MKFAVKVTINGKPNTVVVNVVNNVMWEASKVAVVAALDKLTERTPLECIVDTIEVTPVIEEV